MKFKVGDVVMSHYNTHTIYRVLGITERTVRVESVWRANGFFGCNPIEYQTDEECFYLLTDFDKILYNISWEGI
jgi:hypothetical protein